MLDAGGVSDAQMQRVAAEVEYSELRELGLVSPPATVTLHQGHDLGRPNLLTVRIPAEPGTGIAVTGAAVALVY